MMLLLDIVLAVIRAIASYLPIGMAAVHLFHYHTLDA